MESACSIASSPTATKNDRGAVTEVLFYQLRRQTLDSVLPPLLERCLERGWRAVVQTSSNERAEALDAHLWTYRDDSFLPHGLDTGDQAAEQPILLTAETGNPNDAEIRFLVDGAAPGEIEPYQRVVVVFDGGDDEALTAARSWWKSVSADGHDVSFWEQNEAGRWEKRG